MSDNVNSDEIIKITDKEAAVIINNQDYVLLLFTSQDCGYCQLAKKNLRQILSQLPGLKAYECPLEAVPSLIEKYQVKSAPLIKFFKQGEPVYTGFGVRPPDDLYYQLKAFLPTTDRYQWPEE